MSPISLKTTTSTPIFSNTQRGSTWRALRYCQQPAPKLNRWVLVAQCILLFVNSALISLVRSGTLSWTNNEDLLYSPLSPVITHEVKAFITHEDHLWTGPPDPKTEEKWHQVLQGFDVRVTKTDMQRLDRLEHAVEINDERGGPGLLVHPEFGAPFPTGLGANEDAGGS
ncbi:hypothetical protein DL546_002591 [Coniochaeta pulveracea]|uniref:Uncharacterized protein n=1 Tax=Coniochaeta pulveracea TaxID=177199 RepID=A0A420XZQ2_9PEZI|nr:hypothetical protein DL546_002591 [Coniochaeta pulveracea]